MRRAGPYAQRSAVFQSAPGYGPRHLVFHPNGRILYLLNEMESIVTVFQYDAAGGTISQIQEAATLPEGFKGTSAPAQFQIDRAGKFLYASNRGADNIAVLAIDPAKGKLTPSKRFDAGQDAARFLSGSHRPVPFRGQPGFGQCRDLPRDPKTGRLTPAGQIVENVPEPACVVFVPAQ